MYGEDLDPKKTSDIQATALDFSPRLFRDQADFLAKLRALAEGLR
jgi:hypothetical protein